VAYVRAEHGGSQPDLYEMLGVAPEATREEVVQAWRRRARDEHPDSRPDDTTAPARFRALAEAYRVLADPASRTAYDRAAGHRRHPRAEEPDGTIGRTPPVRRDLTAPDMVVAPAVRVPDVPLRAGPVWIEPAPQSPPPGPVADMDLADMDLVGRDAVLAELVFRYLARWGRPW
jgi:hypothetical protein